MGAAQLKPRSLLYFTIYTAISGCRTSEYENFTIVSPSHTKGHTITWRSSLPFFVLLEREKQQHNWHMVWTKVTPHHAEVRPLKCIIYITRNPVTFVIQRHHKLFLLDQQAWERKHSEAYKWHVHRPPTQPATTAMPKNTAHSGCHQTTTVYCQRWCILYTILYEWTIVFILLLIVNSFENMSKCNMYYWPDMGWEPVWYGLWINTAELKENILKQLKLKGAIPKWTWSFFNTTKMRQNPFGSPPYLPFFWPPHVRLYP